MAFGGLSNILDTINSATGNRPRQPWDEQPEGVSKPPIVIQPQNLAPPSEFIRPRPSVDQLDASNLAGPVPTDMSGGGQQFDYRKALTPAQPMEGPYADMPAYNQLDRSNLAGAVPTNLNGPPVVSPAPAAPVDVPKLHSHALNATDTGVKQPLVDSYNNSLDVNNNHIGKLSRFGSSFLAGGGMANPIQGALYGLLGMAVPSLGNRAKFNMDNARFQNEQAKEMGLERQNTGYQNQLDIQKRQQELPVELQKYQEEQKINYGLRGDYLKQQGQQRLDEIKARGTNMVTAAQTRQSLKNTGDFDGLKALYTGMVDPDTGEKFTDAEADQQARADLVNRSTAKTEKLWSQQNLADKTSELRTAQKDTAVATTGLREAQTKAYTSLAGLRDKQGNMVQDKIDNPDKYFGAGGAGGRGLTANARYNAEMNTYDAAIKHIDQLSGQLEAGKRAGYPDPDYEKKKAAFATDREKLVTQKESRKKELLAAPAGRGGGQNTGGLTPEQNRDYQARKAKHPELTPEDYLKVIQKLNK